MSYLRAFSTLGCPQANLEECFALAERFGLDALEIRALAGTVDLPAYFAATYGSPEAMAEKLDEGSAGMRRIRIAALGTSFRLIGATAKEREAFLDFVPWAEALGVRWLRVFDGGKSADEGELAEAVATVRWWRAERSRRRLTTDLMVETHDALFKGSAIARFVEAAPGTAILWDSHHTWKKGREDPLTTWARVAGAIVHVHVKDSVSIPSARHPFSYTLPGGGEFPAGPLMAALRGEFAGVVSLEWERLWHPTLPPLEDALRAAAERGWW